MTIGKGPTRSICTTSAAATPTAMRGSLFPALRVVTAGDIVSGKNLPLLDANNGGSGVEIGDTLAKAHSTFSKMADTVITGHSRQHDDDRADGIRQVQP